MDIAALAMFAIALFVAAAAPGPGIAAIVARVLGRGPRGAVAFSAGLAFGDVIWLSFAIVGLATLAQTFHEVFLVIKWAGIAYLLYLAYKLWTAPAAPQDVTSDQPPESPLRLFFAGLAVTMGNPKVMVFYMALLPTLIDLTRITIIGYVELVTITLTILTVVLGIYVTLAARARRLFTSAKAVKALNRTTGTVMAGAAVAIASR